MYEYDMFEEDRRDLESEANMNFLHLVRRTVWNLGTSIPRYNLGEWIDVDHEYGMIVFVLCLLLFCAWQRVTNTAVPSLVPIGTLLWCRLGGRV